MPTKHKSPGKSGGRVSRNLISDRLRERILSGEWPPGMQVPTRPELEREFGASPATVQHAFDLLRREEFVRVNGRQGTYVARFPPYRFHYGMVFRNRLGDGEVNRFYQALFEVAARYRGNEQEPRHVSVYTGVEDHVDNREMRQLLTLVRHHGLAGLIFPENPFSTRLAYSALGKVAGLPRVMVGGAPRDGLAAVRPLSFYDKAIDYLAQRGRRRVAVLTNAIDASQIDALRRAIESRGMATRPYWTQRVDLVAAVAARGVAHLLLHRGQEERPDALFITDDNLVEHACAGIVDAGVRVPEELEVVTHCNFPWRVPPVLPVRRLGYDAAAMLAACLDLIDDQRRGAPPGVRTIEPVFEEDLG